MAWKLSGDRPIYLQLMERIQVEIVAGRYPPGSRLPSVRELAAQAAVNPNTMQKALSELETSGLVYSQRTSGRMITEDEEMIRNLRLGLAREQAGEFLEKMESLGFAPGETLELLQKLVEKKEEEV